MGLRIGGSLGKLVKKVANTKVGGVSLGSGLGTVMGPVGTLIGTKARGGSLKDNLLGDAKAGLGNAAKIFPMASALGKGTVTNPVTDTKPLPVNQLGGGLGKGLVDATDPKQLEEWARLDAGLEPTPSFTGGEAGSRFRSIKDFLMDPDNLAGLAGAAGDVYGATKAANREDALYNRERDRWNALAPVRQAGQAGMLNSQRPDFSELFADPSNPQGRYRSVSVGSRGRVS